MSFLSKMLDMLTSAYNKSDEYTANNNMPTTTNIGRILEIAGWGFDLIQDNADRLRLWTDIDSAEGSALDRHGANFGVARGDSDDVFYRLLIKIKILAQISGGDIDTIISAVSGLYEIDAQRVELYELFPAKVQVAIFESDLPESYMDVKDLVGMLIKRLLVGGVGLDMIYKDEDVSNGYLYTGGGCVSEFTRIRLENRISEVSELNGQANVGNHIVSQFTRLRLESSQI